MDPPRESSSGNEDDSNQCDFVTNQMANVQGPNGNFMEGLRVRQNSRRSKSFCENTVESSAQMPGDLMVIERQPITGINGDFQRPAAMIGAPQFGHAFPRPPMQTTQRTSMQATPAPRLPIQATPTSRPPRPSFQTHYINEASPQNVPVQKVRQLLALPSLLQMPIRGSRIPNTAFSAVFRQPYLPIAGPFQNQNGAPRFNGPVDVCSYCRSSGERCYYGHSKKSCPKLASMSPCHRCGAIGIYNHTDMYCPANKTMLKLRRSQEEHQQFMSDLKRSRRTD